MTQPTDSVMVYRGASRSTFSVTLRDSFPEPPESRSSTTRSRWHAPGGTPDTADVTCSHGMCCRIRTSPSAGRRRSCRPTVSVGRSRSAHAPTCGAYLSGVAWCGSTWLCPRCAPVILSRRGQEIDRICRVVHANGGTVLLVTLTCRHHRWDRAADLVPIMTAAFGSVLKGRAWAGHTGKERTERLAAGKEISGGKAGELGYLGLSRVMELTWSDLNGHHPHIHGALCFDRQLSEEQIDEFELWLFARWNTYLRKVTGRTVLPGRGVDVREWHREIDAVVGPDGQQMSGIGEGYGPAWYLTKIGHGWSVGAELTGSQVKEAKGPVSMNPAQLVAAYKESVRAGRPDQKLAAVIKEIHSATFRKHMTYTSPKLRRWVAERDPELTEDEATDEDLVNTDVGGQAVAELDRPVYGWARRTVAIPDLLAGVEADGLAGLVEALWDHGLPVIVTRRDAPDGDGPAPPPLIEFDQSWWHARRPAPRCRATQRTTRTIERQRAR